MHVQELMGHNTDLVTEVNHQLQVEAWSLRQAVHNAVSNAHEHTENQTATRHSWLQAKEMLEVVLNGFFIDLEALNQVSQRAAFVVSAAIAATRCCNQCTGSDVPVPCAAVLYSSRGQEYVEALRGVALA